MGELVSEALLSRLHLGFKSQKQALWLQTLCLSLLHPSNTHSRTWVYSTSKVMILVCLFQGSSTEVFVIYLQRNELRTRAQSFHKKGQEKTECVQTSVAIIDSRFMALQLKVFKSSYNCTKKHFEKSLHVLDQQRSGSIHPSLFSSSWKFFSKLSFPWIWKCIH